MATKKPIERIELVKTKSGYIIKYGELVRSLIFTREEIVALQEAIQKELDL